ncbi:hypothetical protein [Paracoccus methylarcula]|nr:hypothetical protein [Paracoccus methylarcula]
MSLAGHEQIVAPNAAVWEVAITFPRYFNEADLRDFERKVSMMRGRYNVVDLCICDPYKYGSGVNPKQVGFDDGTWFTDGTGFTDADITGGGSQPVLTSSSASAGDTEITIDLAGPPEIPMMRLNDFFSINGFLYKVCGRLASGWMRIEPPLRENVPSGTQIDVDPPHFFGRFATDDEGRRMREFLKWGEQVTVRFVEAFDR